MRLFLMLLDHIFYFIQEADSDHMFGINSILCTFLSQIVRQVEQSLIMLNQDKQLHNSIAYFFL